MLEKSFGLMFFMRKPKNSPNGIYPIYLRITVDDLAVPVGLLLNKAITNAIKYAFDEKGGEVLISMHNTEYNHYLLTIADNGQGLPEIFDLTRLTRLAWS